MSSLSANCFSTGPNQFKSSNDYINEKKAKTIYTSLQKDNGTSYNGPIFINGKCLRSIGGYNTNNYDLLLNVTKGKYYTNPACVYIKDSDCQLDSSCSSISDDSNCSSFGFNYDLYEGPFLLKKDIVDNSNICYSTNISQNTQLNTTTTPSIICSEPFQKIVNDNKLLNFKYPLRFKMR